MDPTVGAVMGFAEQLAGVGPEESVHAATFDGLLRLVPADHVFWTRTDFAHGTAQVREQADRGTGLAEALGAFGPGHPAIRTYVADPGDLTPRRVSDVASTRVWHASALYGEWFAGFGPAHQLSLVVSVDPAGVGIGWTLTRSTSDFRDAEVDLATRLLPVLRLVAGRAEAHPGDRVTAADRLSPREREALRHLATGLTAAAIGRQMGITERTVRKHLDAVYRQAGSGDRLLAVQWARDEGVLP